MTKIKKVTANQSKRTFTIWTESGNKYRTDTFGKAEFNELEYNTFADWGHFVKKGWDLSLIN